MRIKRLFAVGILASVLLCACGGNNGNANGTNADNVQNGVLYDGDGLTVKIVNELSEIQHSTTEWEEVTVETAFVDNDLIVEGTINSVDEISVISSGQGLVYKTLVELTPTKTFKDTNGVIVYNQTVKIVVPVSSRDYESMAPDLIEGKKCVFLAKSAGSIEGDSIDYTKFCDAVVTSPVNYIIPVISKDIYQIRSFYCEAINEPDTTISFSGFLLNYASYYDVATLIYNNEEIPEFTATISIVGMNDVVVKESELLWSFVNKKYPHEEAFADEVHQLYLTSSEWFQEALNSYIK